MESVIVSIKLEWIEKIIRGEKTIEVRKSAPKEVPFRAYIYCTKSKEYEVTVDEVRDDGKERHHNGKGKVVAMFVCDRVEVFTPSEYGIKFKRFKALHETGLTVSEMREYANGKPVYGWHISNLKIYDKPKELSEFKISCNRKNLCYSCNRFTGKPWDICNNTITRPPQSWQFVEELKE